MSISWIAPVAFAGLSLIALPVAVHLLVRQPVRQWPFPSLRFLRETQLAALRRRSIRDAALLCCRMAIIVLGATALAGPVFRTDARMNAFASRTSRAIVIVESLDPAALTNIREGAWQSATFQRADMTDAFEDAIRWLDQQPPSAREIVVAGSLRRGTVTDGDVAQIPKEIGVRFVPIEFTSATTTQLPVLTRRNGRLGHIDRPVAFTSDATQVSDGEFVPVGEELITIYASDTQRDVAEAALRAALDAGIPWSDFTTPVAIVWEGGNEPSRNDIRIVRMPVPQPKSSSADAVMAALVSGTPRPLLPEPVPISSEQISAWTRSPGAVSPQAPVSDEGDRRWIWAAVLLMLAVESWIRRSPSVSASQSIEESRVA